MTKVYIAGKVTGDPLYKEKFNHAAVYVSQNVGPALQPAILPEGMANADYMRICLAMIDTADAVAFLPDWIDSPGAQVERLYCKYIGKPIFDVDYQGKNLNIK